MVIWVIAQEYSMSYVLKLCGCRDWRDFAEMIACQALLVAAVAMLFLPIALAPLWWPA